MQTSSVEFLWQISIDSLAHLLVLFPLQHRFNKAINRKYCHLPWIKLISVPSPLYSLITGNCYLKMIKFSLLRQITASSTGWFPVSSGRRSRLPWWLAMGMNGSYSLSDKRWRVPCLYHRYNFSRTLLISLCFSRLTISSMISPSPLTNLEENTQTTAFFLKIKTL